MSKILHFKAKNFKNIKEVEIVPGDAATIIVGGENAQGKTSVLDGITAALAGSRLIDALPIRTGEADGFVEVLLDSDGTLDPVPIIVRRHWENFGKKTWLTITTQDGYEAPTPQHILNQFFSSVTFDPLAFSRMPPAEQARQLKDLVSLDIDALDEEAAELYEERKKVNQKGVSLKAKLDAMPHHEDLPAEPVNTAALAESLKAARKANREHERLSTARDQYSTGIDLWRAEIVELTEKIKMAEHLRASLVIPEPMDESALIEQLSSATAIASKQADNVSYGHAQVELAEMRMLSKNITSRLRDIAAEKAEALNDIEWPMEGLSVEGDQVLYHGVPLAQVSSSEGLDIAVAIGIAMNPELKVILIKDGALIGDEKLSRIRQRAEELGYQIWIEDVCRNKDDTARCTVIIEDGLIKVR